MYKASNNTSVWTWTIFGWWSSSMEHFVWTWFCFPHYFTSHLLWTFILSLHRTWILESKKRLCKQSVKFCNRFAIKHTILGQFSHPVLTIISNSYLGHLATLVISPNLTRTPLKMGVYLGQWPVQVSNKRMFKDILTWVIGGIFA